MTLPTTLEGALRGSRDAAARAGPDAFETPRLRARPVRPGDEPLLAEILQDEQAAGTVGGVRSDEEIRELLRRLVWHRDTFGFGAWLFSDRDAGRFAGYGGLLRTRAAGELEVEVMYSLAPRCWGRGLATEIAAELVRVAFDGLGLEGLVSYAVPANAPSRRVMEKLGMTFDREITCSNELQVLYRLSAPAGAA